MTTMLRWLSSHSENKILQIILKIDENHALSVRHGIITATNSTTICLYFAISAVESSGTFLPVDQRLDSAIRFKLTWQIDS